MIETAKTTTDREPLLVPGETCWRIARADRVTPIVDAGNYFPMLKAAMLRARHSIMMIGWDFDTQVRLDPDADDGVPDKLGRFVKHVVRSSPELHVYILKWDMALTFLLKRQVFPYWLFKWLRTHRVHFRLDSEHPHAACHHQKIVVIDDALAFCGSIDCTADRWDTRAHLDNDPRRRRPGGRRFGAFHDITTAVDGDAAKALGELARERWRRATGEELAPPPGGSDPWPETLDPFLRDVDLAIARTEPEYNGRPQVREIESLYLTAIAAARETIYLESQYFASQRIADALAARLDEPDGPEIVIVNPERTAGWLEEAAMGSARTLLSGRLNERDPHQRFRMYMPVTAGGEPIYVHAKVMAIDDRLLRIGSSNLNNRSLGFDTECDLAFEALPGTPDRDRLSRAVIELRNDLLGEHLGVAGPDVAAAIADTGSLIAAIDRLRERGGKTLNVLPRPEPDEVERLAVRTQVFDPEHPEKPWRLIKKRLKELLPGSVAEPLA